LIVGKYLGAVKQAIVAVPVREDGRVLRFVNNAGGLMWPIHHDMAVERVLEQYLRVMEDILDPVADKRGRAVISNSVFQSFDTNGRKPVVARMLCKLH